MTLFDSEEWLLQVPEFLTGISEERIAEMQANIAKVWRRYGTMLFLLPCSFCLQCAATAILCASK